MKKFTLFFLIIVLIFPLVASARIGVGVGTGKIKVDEPLKPGAVYTLPSLGVFNTGDESSDYEMGIAYHSTQPELRPAQEWFDFIPSSFYLEPNQSKSVAIRLSLPVKTQPGDYFAYLEAKPVIKSEKGTTIAVAAATKVYFTVIPANIFQAVTYRISYFFNLYAPWTWVVLVLVFGAIVTVFFKKFFSFQLGIKKK